MTFYIGNGKVILVKAVEALRVARGWGSHIFRHSAHFEVFLILRYIILISDKPLPVNIWYWKWWDVRDVSENVWISNRTCNIS
jgi:hypothetical protein